MFRKSAFAAVIAIFATSAAAEGDNVLHQESGPNSGGYQEDCEFVPGWIWDEDSDDFLENYFLECS